MCKHYIFAHVSLCFMTHLQTLWATQLSHQLSRLSELPCADHILPAQLQDQHNNPSPDLPYWTLPRLLWRPYCHRHHQGQRGGLLQHPQAEQLHRCSLPAETGPWAQRLSNRRGDEAPEAGDLHLVRCQDLCLHYIQHYITPNSDIETKTFISYGATWCYGADSFCNA